MKKASYAAILLAMGISGLVGTTAWATENPVERTVFERQYAENLAEYQFMKTAQAGNRDMMLYHSSGRIIPIELEAAPYINADGVLMVAAEDLGNFLSWQKTRKEYLQSEWDEYGAQIPVSVENLVEWNSETRKIRIEVPWREAVNFFVASDSPYAPYWVPYEEGEVLEPWEETSVSKDGSKMKKGKAFIEMTVGSNIWRYRGYGYTARTNCEEKGGRVYLPIKDIHQTLLPYSQYHWDAENKILTTIEGYRE